MAAKHIVSSSRSERAANENRTSTVLMSSVNPLPFQVVFSVDAHAI